MEGKEAYNVRHCHFSWRYVGSWSIVAKYCHQNYTCHQTTFADVLSQLIEKLKHSSDMVNQEPSSHLALFVPDQEEIKSGIWLNPGSTIVDYVTEGIIKSGVRHNNVTICHQMSSNVIKCHQMSRTR